MIDSFIGEYRWLSNFHLVSIEYEGLNYPSSENAYQAAKTLDHLTRIKFTNIGPKKAKELGSPKGIITPELMRPDWDTVKFNIMYDILSIKFADPELKQKLLDTGDEELIEGNWWHDTIWGVCNGVGANHLGKILMKIRSESRV